MAVQRSDLRHDDDDSHSLPSESTLSDEEWPVAPEWATSSPQARPPPDDPRSQIRPRRRLPRATRRRLLPLPLAALLAGLLALAAIWSLPIGADSDPNAAADQKTERSLTRSGSKPSTTRSGKAQLATKRLPDVVGLHAQKAETALIDAGFSVQLRRVNSPRPEGEVLAQHPNGAKASPGSTIVLTISSGPALVSVPRVIGLQITVARRTLRSMGLQVRERTGLSTSPQPTVISQLPSAETKVEPQSAVVLTVTRRPPIRTKVVVPSLVGLTEQAAHARLSREGLRWTTRTVDSAEPAGTVLGQTPTAGAQLREGESVALKVSSGPAQLQIPGVTGLDLETARQQLQSAGFRVEVTDRSTSDPSEDGVVVEQTPQPGAEADEGETVMLIVGRLA
jgi:beta-lactam-binding protein with PASTA domain